MNLHQTKSYHFKLPEELIAAYPLSERSASKLLVVHKSSGRVEHRHLYELPQILKPGTLIIANNTAVFPARLKGTRTGSLGKVEFFLLKKIETSLWQGLMKAAARVQPGFKFQIEKDGKIITAEVVERNQTTAGVFLTARFSEDPVDAGFGEVPLPPYIVAKRGEANASELANYNTVFAKELGSVAAPTAGRHFTRELIAELVACGMSWAEITLHVGLGTFKPVTTEDLRDHQMHEETSFISAEVAKLILDAKKDHRPVLSVGTTSTRTLEGRAQYSEQGLRLTPGETDIDLFIHPESKHDWKIVDALLTNFHLPESTLLMMVASFLGSLPRLIEIYEEAVAKKYRFYSYGDAMLILP